MTYKQDKLCTSALLQKLFVAQDLQTFIRQNEQDMQVPTFHEYIVRLCIEQNSIPEHIIKRASIDRTYGHQLFNGTRKPSRDKVIQLAFGFGMTVEEAQKLLKIADKSPLYPKIKRDAIILHCLDKHKDILETQVILHAFELTILGGEWKYGE